MKSATFDGAITETAKPVAKKFSAKAVRFINGFSYDPHPRRSKAIRAIKTAVPALLAGMFISRLRSAR